MIYLDNSATTSQYDEVTAAMVRAMQEDYGNPSSLYQLGVDAEKAVKAARRHVLEAAGWFAASDWDVVFTSGGTEADNMAIFGAAKALRRQGNRIITTAVEHPAVLECMKQLESEGFEVIRIGVDARCNPDMEQLEEAIDGHTILVSMMHVNNEVGTVMPVGKVKEIMRSKGVPGLFHCDAVQSFGKMPLPSEADLISVSGHKIHGPKGSGALLMNRNTAGASAGSGASGKGVSIPAFIVGGGQESGRRSGTENVPAIIGLGCAAKIAAADGADDADGGYLSMAEIAGMRQQLLDGLCSKIEDIEINSPPAAGLAPGQCCPSVLNVNFKDTRGEVILHTLEQEEICVSTGSACSSNKKGKSHVLEAMKYDDKRADSALRISFSDENTAEDADIIVNNLKIAVSTLARS